MGRMDRIRELIGLLKHADEPDSDFDSRALKQGMDVEKEHSDEPEVEKGIAKAHLDEDPRYYDYLDDMERKMNRAKRK